jgi:hypothetical protein
MLRRTVVASAALLLLALPASAGAVTIVAPADGAHFRATPTLSWTLGAGETVFQPQVADAALPQQDVDGAFIYPDVIGTGLAATATMWNPGPLLAGRYVWIVGAATGSSHTFTAPRSFVIDRDLHPQVHVRVSKAPKRTLRITPQWVANTDTRVTVKITRGTKVVFRKSVTNTARLTARETQSSTFRWRNRTVAKGRRVKIAVTVKAGATTARTTRTARAP